MQTSCIQVSGHEIAPSTRRSGRCMLKILPVFEPIREELELVEERLRQAVATQHSLPRHISSSLLDSGGKRVRPALVILGSKFCSADPEKVLSLAAAVELLHTATLVHDDLLDGSVLRRGNPTLNTSLDAAAVVLVGDFLFARSADLAAATQSVPIVTIFAKTLITICNGEMRQAFEGRGWARTKEDYCRGIYSKTASLFAASSEAGGLLSGADTSIVEALRAYGSNLGMAFQIVDDILDFTGDEKELGKPIGSDLRQGIATLPLLLFLEAHPEAGEIASIRDGAQVTEEETLTLVDLIRGSEAIDSAWEEAVRFTTKAKRAIHELPANGYRQTMLDLAGFLLERRE
jgi:geranylgeranyl pyrophosphate synthase